MHKLAWTAPKEMVREGGGIRFGGWRRYFPERVPAMWRRIAEFVPDDWPTALADYGQLRDGFGEQPCEEALRKAWQRTIRRLGDIAAAWREGDAGVWELPLVPPAAVVHCLQFELNRMVADGGVHLVVGGTELVPEPTTLDAFLWLSAAASLRDAHRFKHCQRCAGWFAIHRTDAMFCSAVCRNKRETPIANAAAAAAGVVTGAEHRRRPQHLKAE